MKKVLSIVICLSLILTVFAACSDKNEPLETVAMTDAVRNGMKIISHRGLSAKAPENTLASFRLACEAGSFGCEFDVEITSDGKWVVMHDDDVKRTTDGKGKVADLTFDEVRNLKIDAGRNIENYPDLLVPTLEETLEVINEYPTMPIIEIKSGAPEDMAGLMKLIEENTDLNKVVMISFDESCIKAVRELYPDVEIWLLANEITDENIAACKEFNFGMDFNNSKKDNADRIAELNEAGIVTAAWTVDDAAEAETLVENGVVYVTSNRLIP